MCMRVMLFRASFHSIPGILFLLRFRIISSSGDVRTKTLLIPVLFSLIIAYPVDVYFGICHVKQIFSSFFSKVIVSDSFIILPNG